VKGGQKAIDVGGLVKEVRILLRSRPSKPAHHVPNQSSAQAQAHKEQEETHWAGKAYWKASISAVCAEICCSNHVLGFDSLAMEY
jgi:hypothetical protein